MLMSKACGGTHPASCTEAAANKHGTRAHTHTRTHGHQTDTTTATDRLLAKTVGGGWRQGSHGRVCPAWTRAASQQNNRPFGLSVWEKDLRYESSKGCGTTLQETLDGGWHGRSLKMYFPHHMDIKQAVIGQWLSSKWAGFHIVIIQTSIKVPE